mmetsp:Transcript_30891/g.51037  ORF Transcript_30891/g.51037 Transcript_30891/m.51037 type:complete len:115 (+) Transcript_30891:100-444(+)
MKHLAAYMLLKLGGNDSPSAADVKTALSSVGVEVDSANLDRLMKDLEGKDLAEIMESGKGMLVKMGGGGGGGGAAGGAAAEEEVVEEEKPVEEEMDMAGGMDMFGGDEGGGSDY